MFYVGGEFFLHGWNPFSPWGLWPCKRLRAHATWQFQLKHLRDFWWTEMRWWSAMFSKKTENWEILGNIEMLQWWNRIYRVLCLNRDVRSFWGPTTSTLSTPLYQSRMDNLATNYWMMLWANSRFGMAFVTESQERIAFPITESQWLF